MNADSIGMNICHSGLKTAGMTGYSNPTQQCGPLTQLYFAPSYMYTPSPAFRVSDAQSRSGDSGGAFWWSTIYGDLAFGLMSGKMCGTDTCHADSILSHLPYVLDAWGLTVQTN